MMNQLSKQLLIDELTTCFSPRCDILSSLWLREKALLLANKKNPEIVKLNYSLTLASADPSKAQTQDVVESWLRGFLCVRSLTTLFPKPFCKKCEITNCRRSTGEAVESELKKKSSIRGDTLVSCGFLLLQKNRNCGVSSREGAREKHWQCQQA